MVTNFPLQFGNVEGHKHEDFTKFIFEDFPKYDMYAEFLFDEQFKEIPEVTDLKLPIIRKSKLTKKWCKEFSPGEKVAEDSSDYYDKYAFWSASNVQQWSLDDMFRQELRELMDSFGTKMH